MENRRAFLKSAATLSLAGLVGAPANPSAAQPIVTEKADDRSYWLAVLEKIATPVLRNLSQRELRKKMPVEAANPRDRAQYTHLEALGRLLAGLAPWLAAPGLDDREASRQKKFIGWAQASLDAATDPGSPDFMNFHRGGQPLVDTAFLANGILRAPSVLWDPLPLQVRHQITDALKSSRAIGTPTTNNWVMFAAMVEAALLAMGEATIEDRLENGVRRMLGWYKGDGFYGDGDFFHFDYYNSFVIHPMLLDVLTVLRQHNEAFGETYETILRRAQRYAAIQERLIAPDGSFPAAGRSITYRFGVFQLLAQMALIGKLPVQITPPQVRHAMTTVIRRMIEAPDTFDENGWLRAGFCGHQPSLAENYISTGSLYLCTTALLPLGLPPTDPFWSQPGQPWTAQQLWSGKSLPADHALSDVLNLDLPTLHRP
jgi:hypothetical protein